MRRYIVEFNNTDCVSTDSTGYTHQMVVDAETSADAINAVKAAYPTAVIHGCIWDSTPREIAY